MVLLLTLACVENAVVKVGEDAPAPFDEGTTPTEIPTDTTVPTTPPEPVAPTVDIVSPEGAVPGCTAATLVGVVTDDAPLVELSVQWLRDGIPYAYAVPDADGRVTLEVEAVAAEWRLTAVDLDGLRGEDTLALVVDGFDAATWDLAPVWERSAMDDRVLATGTGTCMADALRLATAPTGVWDDGVYTPPTSAADGTAAGRSWASWDQVGTDCHLFRLRVQIPSCPFTAVHLQSPWYVGIPINDNLYVYAGGVEIARDGTGYGVGYGGPAEVDTYLMDPVDVPASVLTPGAENEILLVTEEYAAWGGLGYMDVSLVP